MGLIQGFKGMILPTGVSLSANTASVGSGATYQLEAYIVPELASNNKIHWSASNNNVTVDENGLVTGVTDGTSVVTATTDYGGYTASCTFTVFTINVTGVSLNESEISLGAGDTYQLEATITPSDATNKNVTWRSTNTSIATVDNNGLVTCVTPGECQIIVTTVDGNYTASCDIVSGYIINENTLSYFPFEEDFIDKKGNRTLTVNDCVIDEGSAKIKSKSSYITLSSTIGGTDMTASLWYYPTAFNSSGNGDWNTIFARNGGSYHHLLISGGNSAEGTVGKVGFWNNSWTGSSAILKTNRWYNIIITKNGTNEKIYVNGELVLDSNSSFDNASYQLGMISNYGPSGDQGANGKISEVIFEQGNWDVTKVKKYFNNTKKKFFGSISDYQELEYIESTGTQYIDTGVSAPNGFKSQLKICITGQVGQTLIGSHNVNSPYGRNNINTYTSGATWGLHMNDEMINGLGSIVIGQDCEIEMSTILGASYLTVDGIRLTNGTNTSPMSANNILILQNQYGIAHGDGCNKAKIYYCKIYDSSETLVRDFVPCYRKADSIIGMYDKVTGVFYPNDGTGTFTAGPKIGVSLDTNSISLTEAGQTYQLTATPNPASVGAQGYQWRSSDITIATVNSSGLVTCVTPGECVITCTAVATGDTDTCNVVIIEEYILLSEGGSINKFSELARSTQNSYPQSLFDEGTRWRANVTTTDQFTTMYKSFNKNIVKFEIKFQYTENYSYSSIFFGLQPTNGSTDIGEPGEFDISNGQDTYSGWSGIKIYRGTTQQNYTSSGVTTSDVTVVGEKNGNTWTLTFTGGKNFTYSFDETNDCKRIFFGAWRRWTGTQGYFKKVVVYLK